MDKAHVIEIVGNVPMKACTPDILGGGGVVEDCLGAMKQQIAIVIPNNELHILAAATVKCGAKVVTNKITLLLMAVNT